jgi:hypothetical protein
VPAGEESEEKADDEAKGTAEEDVFSFHAILITSA